MKFRNTLSKISNIDSLSRAMPQRPFCNLEAIGFGLATFIFLLASQSAYGQEVRTWVDSSGQFKIEAAYEKFENDNVFLKLADGQLKQIPYSMLSTGDQARVRELNKPTTPAEPPTSPGTTPPTSNPPITTTPTVAATPEADLTEPADASKPTDMPKPADAEPADVPETSYLTKADLAPPKPIVHVSQDIGDLDISEIQPPKFGNGQRSNPKYLLPVEKNEIALLPREFQTAALLLLDEPNKPRDAVKALDYLKVKWPRNRQPTLIKLVINCASSDHKYNRETALEILSNRDSDQSFAYLFARVDDTSFTIRSMAYQLLRQVGDRRAIEPLARRFASDDVDRIASLLRSFGAASEAPMLPYLKHEDPDIRLRACNLIGKIGTEKSLPALQEMAGIEQTMMLKAQTRGAINKIKRRSENRSQ